ncbi:MAG: dTMP kinase [Janthinobacterium lividum]
MTPTDKGIFITFEGPDGSGKTTQIARLATWLRSRHHEPVLLRQPGGTALGERIRAILLDSRGAEGVGQIAPLTELALMFGDRAQSIREIIQPGLASGKIILCDRYTDSSEAYQGAGRGLGSDRVLALHRAVCDNLQPDLTILLLPDVDAALHRARSRNRQQKEGGAADENRFETEGEAFYRRVHQAYLNIAKRDAARVQLIEGDDTIETVEQRVRGIVLNRFPHLQEASPSSV